MVKLSLLIVLFVDVAFGKVEFKETSNASKLNYNINASINLLSMSEKNSTEVEKFIPLIAKYNSERSQMTFVVGDRTSGDTLVAQGSDSVKFPDASDVRLMLEYPGYGEIGAKVTYVEIVVEQSSDLVEAYIVSGGIGKRSIEIYVDFYLTTYVTFSAYNNK